MPRLGLKCGNSRGSAGYGTVLTAGLVLLLSLPWTQLAAQQTTVDGDTAISRLTAMEADLRALGEQLTQATGDNRESIRQRFRSLQRQYREMAWKYVDISSESTPVDLDSIKAYLNKVSGRLQEQLEDNVLRIRELQLAAESSPGKTASEINDALRIEESHRIELLDAMVRNIVRFDHFGLDPGDDGELSRVKLRNLAQILSGRIELEKLRREATGDRISGLGADSAELADAKKQFGIADANVTRSAAQLSDVADLLEQLGEDVTEYRQTEFMATGNLSAEVLDHRVAGSVLRRWIEDMKLLAFQRGPDLLTRLIVVAIILLAFWMLSRVVRVVVRRGLDNLGEDMSTLARDFLVGFSVKVVLVSGILVALSQFGLKIGPLLAGLGIVGFIVGFALQDTLSNFASGIMILIYRPFDVGDYVQAAGVEGEVRRMNLVSTTVHTPENHRLVIPNNKIWGDIIRNITSQAVRRVDLSIGVDYGDDIEQVERLLSDVVNGHALVKSTPEPVVRLHNLGDSAVEYTVRAWVDSDDYMAVYWDLVRQIKLTFDAHGIRFPYPQRTVHLVSGEQPNDSA
jgi:small conductance mechanosensitive channel